jgi:hypothetical protein
MHRNVALFERDMLKAFANMFADPAASAIHPARRQAYATLYLMLSGSFLEARNFARCLQYGVRSLVTWPPSVLYLMAFPIRVIGRRLRLLRDTREPVA